MKLTTLVLGDTHGRTLWKDVINKEEFNRLILLGDYFDSRKVSSEDQINNFLDIIEYKKACDTTEGKEVVLLVGNHDFHYLGLDIPYSGYQEDYAPSIRAVIAHNLHHLKLCYGNYRMLFSHAGLTNTWLKYLGYNGETNYIDYVNLTFKYNPRLFMFCGPEQYGDNVAESPIWVRPRSLIKDAYRKDQLTQIVGHTTMKRIKPYKKYWFIDTLGTSGEYLKIEEDEMANIIFTIEHV